MLFNTVIYFFLYNWVDEINCQVDGYFLSDEPRGFFAKRNKEQVRLNEEHTQQYH